MKLHHSLIAMLGVILAAIACMPSAFAQDPEWKPTKADNGPWEALDNVLEDAQSVLYLDSSCKVVAFLIPDAADLPKYVPKARQLRSRWFDRKRSTTVTGCTTPATFLDTTFVIGPNANACKPGQLLSDAQLVGVTCQIAPNNVANLIVLDAKHDPLLILDGQLAKRLAPIRFPATHLSRTAFDAACAPAIPSPCLAPRSGVTKIINGQQVCVCQ
jgi:hypothetical protein